MFKSFVIISCFVLSSLTFGKDVALQPEEGTLQLSDLLDACEEVAMSKPSKRVQTNIPGKIITIKDVLYEIRFFSFEDTSGKVSPDTTFRDYAKKSKILPMKSASIAFLPGIQFESFDFRRSRLKDGVYFSMAVRKLEK